MLSWEEPWTIDYYADRQNRQPVREFLNGLDAQTRARCNRGIALLEERGMALTMPYVRRLTGYGLWEIRVVSGRDAIRIFYFAATGRRLVLLHAFAKKAQRTPQREIDTALRRKVDYESRQR